MVTVRFASDYVNVLIVLYGLFILLFLYASRRKEQRVMLFGNYDTLERVAGGTLISPSHLLLVIRILGVTAFIIGISAPVIVTEVPRASATHVVALDASATMTTADIDPDRFGAATDVTQDFLDQIGNTSRAGVISFAGDISKETDGLVPAPEAREAVNGIEIGTTPGTALGSAIQAASTMLIGVNGTRRVVLVTDGENNVGISLNESVQYARDHNVSVYPIGIGTQRNETDRSGSIGGVNATRAAFPNLNVDGLRSIADQTGGNASFVQTRGQLRAAFVDVGMQDEEHPVSQHFILAGVLFLLLEWIYRTSKHAPLP